MNINAMHLCWRVLWNNISSFLPPTCLCAYSRTMWYVTLSIFYMCMPVTRFWLIRHVQRVMARRAVPTCTPSVMRLSAGRVLNVSRVTLVEGASNTSVLPAPTAMAFQVFCEPHTYCLAMLTFLYVFIWPVPLRDVYCVLRFTTAIFRLCYMDIPCILFIT